jgi:hypothetical protein
LELLLLLEDDSLLLINFGGALVTVVGRLFFSKLNKLVSPLFEI